MWRSILIGVVAAGAGSAWLTMVYHWLKAIGHRKESVSLGKLLVSGLAAFDQGNFKESGHRHVRGLTHGMLAFFAAVALLVLVAALLHEPSG